MENLQYQTEVENYIDNLVIKLQKDCPEKSISRNEFNDYLVFSATQSVSIKDAFICADAFFELRWIKLIELINTK
jgi:hypothetical protein